MPNSEPVIPAQPTRPEYGPDSLWLFTRYNRDSYQKAFGTQPPPWNPEARIKRWWDSTVDLSDPNRLLTYKMITKDPLGNPVLQDFTITAQEAATFNLPGKYDYPKYSVAPTKAVTTDGLQNFTTLDPMWLSHEDEAKAIVDELNAVSSDGFSYYEHQLAEHFRFYYPPDEPRRLFYVKSKKVGSVNVGLLLLDKYTEGIGSPGHWEFLDGIPDWKSDLTVSPGEFDARPECPFPVRDLLSNERLNLGFGGVIVIQNTSKPPFNTSAQGGDGFSGEDRTILLQIRDAVTK